MVGVPTADDAGEDVGLVETVMKGNVRKPSVMVHGWAAKDVELSGG
jgi:hypothetical protein